MEKLLAYLTSLPATSVYLSLGGILVLCGLGLPIPEDISLIAAGYLAHLGLINVHTALVVCLAAVLGGDTLAFMAGYFFGRRLLAWEWMRKHFTPRRQRRVRAYFRRFGSKVIFIARFLPGLRFSIFFSAGCLHVRPSVFIIWDGLAALLSVPALVYLAYFFGEHLDAVVRWARRSQYGILVLCVVAAAILVTKMLIKRRKRACAAGTTKALPQLTPPPGNGVTPQRRGTPTGPRPTPQPSEADRAP